MGEDRDVAICVINLDRSPERLHSAARQLDELGRKCQRVGAIDGGMLGEAAFAPSDREAFVRHVGRNLAGGEFALYLSHIKAMQIFLQSSMRFGLIFEDDLSIDDIPAFDRLVDALTRQRNRWDIVKLSGTRRRTLPVPEARVDKKHVLAVPLLKTTGACCYMINRRGAEIIPKALEPFTDHFDHQLDQPWRFGLRYRIVHPFPVREAAFGSTIDYSHRCAKFRAWDRRYALYYRFRTGLRRLGYNARHGFFASSLVSYFTG